MRKQRIDGQETRYQLLCAASEVFSEKGFWEATIAEICQKAKANLAAANYHFGSKELLYIESWRYAFDKSLKAYPPDGGIPPEAAAEKRLYGWILSVIRRVVDPKSQAFDIMHKEMANPTGLLTDIIQESIKPIFQRLVSIIHELLGKQATEQQARLCLMSVRAQCFGPLLRARLQKKASRSPKIPGVEVTLTEDVKVLADHVTRFSLAGIQEIRKSNKDHINLHR
ncbi:MAG: CerR family C-terminal domain-containing protein [Desulfobacteraceae bacterium]|nr:CerR family C-terminal domain-containing protein [Desulfobacteraceae bacterium]